MQQLIRKMRLLVFPAALVFLIWAGYRVIATPYLSDKNGKILVVYNGDLPAQDCSDFSADRENLSEEAVSGLCKAPIDSPGPQIVLVNLRDNLQAQGDLRQSGVYGQLGREISRGAVLGVISLLASPDSLPVVRFCRAMQIPLLLGFAANDNLLAKAEDTRGIVFRMIPTNKQQAHDIALWIKSRASKKPKFRIAVFHEPNTYGEFLNRRLRQELLQIGPADLLIYNFEVPDQPEFADMMPELWCDRFDLAVYLGYQSRALDLLNKMRWFRADKNQVSCQTPDSPDERSHSFAGLTVLLSDGAYQDSLNETNKYNFPFQLFAALPTNATKTKRKFVADEATRYYSPKPEDLGIPSQYGYDAYTLMARLAKDPNTGSSEIHEILSHKSTQQSKTGYRYRFLESGELDSQADNDFLVYELNWNKTGEGRL